MNAMKRKASIVLWMVAAGLCYGFLSAGMNRNPHYGLIGGDRVDPVEEEGLAWDWEPSVVWLPSYLLCKVARNTGKNWAGVTYTKSGYMFRSRFDLFAYFVFAGIIGALMGWLIGVGIKVKGRKGSRLPQSPSASSQ